MSDLTMREATEADLPAIIALLIDDPLGEARGDDAAQPLDPAYLAAFRAIAADANQVLIVADLDGAIVGTFQLSFLPGLSRRGAWRGQIEAVRIASGVRSQGLGARMIDWAVAQCRARGCHIVQLSSNASRVAAHRFYERLGFVKSHVGMKLNLT